MFTESEKLLTVLIKVEILNFWVEKNVLLVDYELVVVDDELVQVNNELVQVNNELVQVNFLFYVNRKFVIVDVTFLETTEKPNK